MSRSEYSVLFVCTANRIRSVMAEAIFRKLIQSETPLDDWRTESAGTWAVAGLPPMPKAVQAMIERGLDVREHRSRSVDDVRLSNYGLILVMEHGHHESLVLEFPEIADRVHLISEIAGSRYEIQDPVTGTLQDYRHTAEVLEQILGEGLDQIRELARNGQRMSQA